MKTKNSLTEIIFYMENEVNNKSNLTKNVINILKKKSKLIYITIILILILLASLAYFNYSLDNKHNKISEKYIQAEIYLTSKDKKNSKNIYEIIIFSKNKFYSPLALNKILENDLEKNNQKILQYFDIVESIRLEKEKKNLVKLKKSIFLFKILKKDEGKKLLQEIISDDSIWSATAIELLK